MLIARWVVLLIAAFLAAGDALAQSQPPSPTPSKAGQKQKTDTSKTAKDAKAAQSEPKNSPLSVTVDNPVTIQKSEQDRHAEASDSEHKASNERWLIVWTAVLACTTLLLAAITAFLAKYTYKLWRDAKETSERQGREMKESLRIAAIASEAAKESAETARREFFSARRPRLVVRRMSIVEVNGTSGFQYFIHNIGDSEATILSVSEKVWLPITTENLPFAPPDYDTAAPMTTTTIKSGGWMGRWHSPIGEIREQFDFALGFGRVTNKNEVLNNIEGGGGILFLGFIEYKDQAGTARNTAFLRRYDFTTGRFTPIDDPDYEYQD